MLSTIESGIRQETLLPGLKREGLRRVLEEFVDGYQEMADESLRSLGYLSQGGHIRLNPSIETKQYARIINLHSGVLKEVTVSFDLIFPWCRIDRSSQIITRNPQEIPRHYSDLPAIHKVMSGRMGIYTGENYKREEILHDDIGYGDRWDYAVVSGRRPYKIYTWDRHAYVLTIVPDSAYVTAEQINLPL